MALFRILKGNEVNLPEKKREGFAYFTIDENDFYIDTESSTTDAAGKESGGARKQLNANRAHYLKSKDINKNVLFDQLYIDDEEISLGRKAGESNYEAAYNASVVTSAGIKSIAVGYAASATGNYSSSFGSSTIANGDDSHAEGRGAKAYGEVSHAEGADTLAEGDFSHAEGVSTKSLGDATHAEGHLTKAENYYSHAEGSETHANGFAAHAEGSGAEALNRAAHAEGNYTIASGEYSHAEGDGAEATGETSHAEGHWTTASGKYSHAGGNLTDTNEHEGAFVHGFHVSAQADYQTVFGKYSNAGLTDAFVVGVGTSEEDYSNGFSVDWDGHATLKDSLLVGRDPVLNLEVTTKQYVDAKIDEVGDNKLFAHTVQLTQDSSTVTFDVDGINITRCLVYYNGLLLVFGENYRALNEKTIELIDWTGKAGDYFILTGRHGGGPANGGLDVGTVGSPSKPVYFSNGLPVACDFSLAGSSYLYSKKPGQDGLSTITFDNDGVNINNCLVYYNGLLLNPGENYTVTNNNTINLIEWTTEADDLFIIVSNQLSTSGNDYAEYRTQIETIEPGYCVASTDDGKIYKTIEKFQACDGIVSDTYGMLMGRVGNDYKTPLAVAGRVLAYCEGDRNSYHAGDTVCAGPNGKIVKMTREEIKEYPDRIIGHVSEIPNYEFWGDNNVKVNDRIWIKIK